MYNTSLIGPIFSLVGLLIGIGVLGASKRDHTMMCVVSILLLQENIIHPRKEKRKKGKKKKIQNINFDY